MKIQSVIRCLCYSELGKKYFAILKNRLQRGSSKSKLMIYFLNTTLIVGKPLFEIIEGENNFKVVKRFHPSMIELNATAKISSMLAEKYYCQSWLSLHLLSKNKKLT